MTLYGIQHRDGQWFTSRRGHTTWSTTADAANTFNSAQRGTWKDGYYTGPRKLSECPEWQRKEVRLVPVETP